MPNTNTLIQLKRSASTSDTLSENQEILEYGEPLFFEEQDNKNICLAIGNKSTNFEEATFFNGVTDTSLIGKGVYIDGDNNAVDSHMNLVDAGRVNPQSVNPDANNKDTFFYVLSYYDNGEGNANIFYHSAVNGIYITGNGVLHGAAWNDYAERRVCGNVEPGTVVCENGDGTLSPSKEKLQPLPYVVSDTFVKENVGIDVLFCYAAKDEVG